MARSDYAHWNEEQDRVWWEEEGKHHGYEDPPDPDDESWRDEPLPENDHESVEDCRHDGDYEQSDDHSPWVCSHCGRRKEDDDGA